LTLYVTPVFYIWMDRLQKRLGRRRGEGRPSAPPLAEPERPGAREEEAVPATAALRSVET
jgi:hypothetical protein